MNQESGSKGLRGQAIHPQKGVDGFANFGHFLTNDPRDSNLGLCGSFF